MVRIKGSVQGQTTSSQGTDETSLKPVHYHTLLTSLLQRRFARAAFLSFLASYAVAYAIGHGSCKSYFGDENVRLNQSHRVLAALSLVNYATASVLDMHWPFSYIYLTQGQHAQ